jgi:hypothetical protein
MNQDKSPGFGMKAPQDTPPEVQEAILNTMKGIAESKGFTIANDKLKTAAMLVAIGAEEAGQPITLEEAQSPHSELMKKIERAVEARNSI